MFKRIRYFVVSWSDGKQIGHDLFHSTGTWFHGPKLSVETFEDFINKLATHLNVPKKSLVVVNIIELER